MLTKIAGGLFVGSVVLQNEKKTKCWIYRDDIGAFWGIKGYEEQVSEVGTHHGHYYWPQEATLGQYNSGSVRRGFQVFSRNCANCHGMSYRRYDFLLDRGYKQLELAAAVSMFSINPGHHHFKGYFYQEWDDRDRVITDRIYAPYISQDESKNANQGVWPVDLSKIRQRPGGTSYVYNILTGYHYQPPFGLDVPKGKHFNPYFDHMIVGMARQLYDGMIDYDDGTPASTPQMAYDVTNFISYMQRRGGKAPDFAARTLAMVTGAILLMPLYYFKMCSFQRGQLGYRLEAYAVRDGKYYSHFRTGQVSFKTKAFRNTVLG